MNAMLLFLRQCDLILTRVLKFVTVSLFVVLLLILTANVAARLLPFGLSLHWLDEIVELCFASLVFYGAAALWMTKGHFSAGNWISKVCKRPGLVGLYRVGVELASLLFAGILFKYSLSLTFRSQEVTAVFQIPKTVLYSAMPLSAALMVLYSVGAVLAEISELCRPKSGLN